jgi:hypothetical protein
VYGGVASAILHRDLATLLREGDVPDGYDKIDSPVYKNNKAFLTDTILEGFAYMINQSIDTGGKVVVLDTSFWRKAENLEFSDGIGSGKRFRWSRVC